MNVYLSNIALLALLCIGISGCRSQTIAPSALEHADRHASTLADQFSLMSLEPNKWEVAEGGSETYPTYPALFLLLTRPANEWRTVREPLSPADREWVVSECNPSAHTSYTSIALLALTPDEAASIVRQLNPEVREHPLFALYADPQSVSIDKWHTFCKHLRALGAKDVDNIGEELLLVPDAYLPLAIEWCNNNYPLPDGSRDDEGGGFDGAGGAILQCAHEVLRFRNRRLPTLAPTRSGSSDPSAD